jgi:hypothetical protein
MRNVLASLLLFLTVTSLAAQDSDNTKTPAKASTATADAFKDSHEGLTIGVEPWTLASRYKEKFPKKSPFSKGIVAIHVSFHNDTDHGLKVNLQSIRLLVQLSEENRQELSPLSAEDVADTVTLKDNGKDPTAKRSPLPIPLPTGGVKSGRDSSWTALRDACQNAGVPSSVLAAHSTVEGLVYFDIRGELDLLQNAHMYFPNIMSMGDNQPLSYFDIALGHDSSE